MWHTVRQRAAWVAFKSRFRNTLAPHTHTLKHTFHTHSAIQREPPSTQLHQPAARVQQKA